MGRIGCRSARLIGYDGGMKLRFRYSLRTLFILLTIVAAWLGWQVHIVQVRKTWLVHIDSHNGNWSAWDYDNLAPPFELPWYRRLLGDQLIGKIMLYEDCTEEDAAKIRKEFPESEIDPYWDGLDISVVPIVG